MTTLKKSLNALSLIGLSTLTSAFSFANTIERVSVNDDGQAGNGRSAQSIISGDGRFVVFESRAGNLVANDNNEHNDVFVRDLVLKKTSRVSVDSFGNEALYPSLSAAASGPPFDISADGRYVVFESLAYNLVEDDNNEFQDIFVHDTNTGTTVRISVSTTGEEADGHTFDPSMSDDGRYIAFRSSASNLIDGESNDFGIYLHDLHNGTTEKVISRGLGPRISENGRFIAFTTPDNLVTGDTNRNTDVYVYDLETEEIEIISVDSAGNSIEGRNSSNAISAFGRFVAFASSDTSTVPFIDEVYLRDRLTGTTTLISGETSARGNPSISFDGRFVSFTSDNDEIVPSDNNGVADIFVYDHLTRNIENVSVDEEGNEANGRSYLSSLSGDGRYVAFGSEATNLVPDDLSPLSDIFVVDRGPILPQSTLGNIVEKIQALVPEFLKKGQAGALVSKLNTASASLESERTRPACQQLNAFLSQLSGLIKANQLDRSKGQELIDDVTAIQNQIGCFN